MGAAGHSKCIRQHLFIKSWPGNLRAYDLCEEWNVADNSLHQLLILIPKFFNTKRYLAYLICDNGVDGCRRMDQYATGPLQLCKAWFPSDDDGP